MNNNASSENEAKKIVLSFIECLNKEDFKGVRNYVNDDMKFEGVLGSRNGAGAYFNDMQKMKFKYDIKQTFVNGNDVCLLYDINMGKGTVFTCGWYQLHNNKINSLRVVFDPRPVLNPQ